MDDMLLSFDEELNKKQDELNKKEDEIVLEKKTGEVFRQEVNTIFVH